MLKAGSEREESTSDREIVVSRRFAAPRALVFDAWTDAAHISSWWGPSGFTTRTLEMDVRPGGVWRHVMVAADGTEFPNHIVYQEVVRPERLSYTNAERAGADPWFTSFVTFEEVEGGTHLTLRMVFATAELRDRSAREFGAVEGGHQTLARLAEHLGEAR